MADVLEPVEGRFARNYQGFAVLALSLGGGLIFAFALVWILLAVTGKVSTNPIAEAVSLPLIVIVGVSLLLIAIALVAFTFSVIGLSSAKDALGLPDGSVRAVIALMLLVIFSIMAIFLYNNIANPKLLTMEHVTDANIQDMSARVVIIGKFAEAQPAAAVPPTFKVTFRELHSPAEDIAKQLIVMLGTLVTAVASFYFGSASVASASAAMRPQATTGPHVTLQNPLSMIANSQEQNLTLGGSGLAVVKNLHLEQSGKADIVAKLGDVKDNLVPAKITIPSGTSGLWNIVISDGKVETTVGTMDIKAP